MPCLLLFITLHVPCTFLLQSFGHVGYKCIIIFVIHFQLRLILLAVERERDLYTTLLSTLYNINRPGHFSMCLNKLQLIYQTHTPASQFRDIQPSSILPSQMQTRQLLHHYNFMNNEISPLNIFTQAWHYLPENFIIIIIIMYNIT